MSYSFLPAPWIRMLIGLTLLIAPCSSQDVIPLTVWETDQLIKLNSDVDVASKAYDTASKKLCAAQDAIKKAHAARETSGGCGLSAWSTEWTTGNITSGSSRWRFDRGYKYLIHEGSLR